MIPDLPRYHPPPNRLRRYSKPALKPLKNRYIKKSSGDTSFRRRAGHVGAVAFSRTGDPTPGDFGDAKVNGKFGDVPDDLSTL
jgi:hypothetical protein